MRIIFIRHGNPDYELDELTELGHIQARAVAEALSGEGIERIYASTHRRAMQTAEYTAKALGLPIQACDFIRELTARLKKDPNAPWTPECSPWLRSLEYKNRALPLLDPDWRSYEPFADIDTPEQIDRLYRELDEWLLSLGIERCGLYYKLNNPKYNTVAMFCHAMSYSASLAHIFNLTYPFVLLSFSMPQTGVTVIEFKNEENGFAFPRLMRVGNVDHLINNNIEIT